MRLYGWFSCTFKYDLRILELGKYMSRFMQADIMSLCALTVSITIKPYSYQQGTE